MNCWLIMAFSFLIYANTLSHDYTQDDAIVIYDNMFTTQGVAGIPGILKYDTFYGFFKKEGKANLVAGGRYRPLTLVMYALEVQLFSKKKKDKDGKTVFDPMDEKGSNIIKTESNGRSGSKVSKGSQATKVSEAVKETREEQRQRRNNKAEKAYETYLG